MDRIIEVKVSGNHLSKDNKNAGVRGEANATQLRITFDEGWNAYKSKKVTFWDARGLNPVECILGIDKLENALKSDKIYIIPIPEEPLAEAGMLTFVIDGYSEGKKQRSISDQLMVKDAPIADNAGEPADPTATPTEQLQVEIEKIKGTIIDAIAAKESIENMGVSVETLKTDEEASVKKYTQYLPEENIEVAHLHFGIPKGNAGKSAYEIAVDNGFEGTEKEWNDAVNSARTAAAKAAISAQDSATSAKQSEETAADKATEATRQANNAAKSAETSESAATDARESESKATEAAACADNAAKSAKEATEGKADKDLSNVSDADFKAKFNEAFPGGAGGGDAGTYIVNATALWQMDVAIDVVVPYQILSVSADRASVLEALEAGKQIMIKISEYHYDAHFMFLPVTCVLTDTIVFGGTYCDTFFEVEYHSDNTVTLSYKDLITKEELEVYVNTAILGGAW